MVNEASPPARAVQIRAGAVELRGDLTIPEGATGLVLFAHGSGSGRMSPRNRYVADVMHQGGLATLLMDFNRDFVVATGSIPVRPPSNDGMKRMLWLLVALTVVVPGLSGAGLIVIQDPQFWPQPMPHPIPPPSHRPRPPVQRLWAPMEVRFTKVETEIKDQLATTKVDQEFYNPNDRQLEGTFLFPVPKGAQIKRFTMEINGKQVEAELLAADKARDIYQDIVRKMKDPALLEYADRDLFKVRIFPIEAHSAKRISLSYQQLLPSDTGMAHYAFPLNTEKFSAKPLKSLSVKVDLQTRRPLKSIYSPSHSVEIKRDGDRRATIGFEGTDIQSMTDFQLLFSEEEGEFGLRLLTQKTGADDGYFLLLASPGAENRNEKALPKDLVFVLDTSGSMAGAKLEQARKALLFCVENLNDNDRFEVMRFATEVESLFGELSPATPAGRKRARDFLENSKPLGGTAIHDALQKSLTLRPAKTERPYMVIFLTDGRPTIGVTDEEQILKVVTRDPHDLTRIFCFGIGTDVNTHLLDRITERTKAYSQYVLPEEDLEVKVSSFFTKIKEPALSNPKVVFPDGIRVTKLYPSPVPDLFKGQQLVLAGRYAGHGKGRIEIQGTVGNETKTFAYDAEFPKEASGHDFIPRLWATRRVGYLMDEIRLQGDNKELKDEVTELARQYGIVTPYTAYLILEDEQRRDVPTAMRSLPRFEQDVLLRRETQSAYSGLSGPDSGDKAVAGARSFYSLKTAEASSDAIARGSQEAMRGQIAPAATPAPAARQPGVSRNRIGVAGTTEDIAKKSQQRIASDYTDQGQFVGGRAFYRNGEQWIDAEVQRMTDAKRVRIAFESDEYFKLVAQHPETLPWLSLGRSLQFALGNTVYEIHE